MRDEYLDLARDLKKTMEHDSDSDTNRNWFSDQSIGTGTGGLGNKKTSRDHPNHSIKIGQNIKKNPGELRWLAEAQSPVKTHLKRVFKK